jgi:hypothetical protein
MHVAGSMPLSRMLPHGALTRDPRPHPGHPPRSAAEHCYVGTAADTIHVLPLQAMATYAPAGEWLISATRSFRAALATRLLVMPLTMASESSPYRLTRYNIKGFLVAIPLVDRAKVKASLAPIDTFEVHLIGPGLLACYQLERLVLEVRAQEGVPEDSAAPLTQGQATKATLLLQGNHVTRNLFSSYTVKARARGVLREALSSFAYRNHLWQRFRRVQPLSSFNESSWVADAFTRCNPHIELICADAP